MRSSLIVVPLLLALAGCGASYEGPKVRISPTSTAKGQPEDTKTDFPKVGLNVADVEVTFKTKSKQCFGSAGCNLVVTPRVALRNDLSDNQSYEVTFKVYGDDSGPVTETVTVTGDQLSYHDIFLSTSSSSVKVRGKVTDVEELT